MTSQQSKVTKPVSLMNWLKGGLKMIIKFRLRKRATRNQALNWLLLNYDYFPLLRIGEVREDMFHGWRFINVEGINYFANCIESGISEKEFNGIKWHAYAEEKK